MKDCATLEVEAALGEHKKLGSRQALQSQQLHFFPQLQALLSFIGQFLPLFLQLCGVGSAANALVQIAAARIENRIFAYVFMLLISFVKWAKSKPKMHSLVRLEYLEGQTLQPEEIEA